MDETVPLSRERCLNGFLKLKKPWPNKVCGSLPWPIDC